MSTSSTGRGFPGFLVPVSIQVQLANGASAELPSVVLDVEDTDGVARVVVGAPDRAGSVQDRELTLLWAEPSGQLRLPVAAAPEVRPYGAVWVLTPAGEPVLDQRRQHFRTALRLPVVLIPYGDGEDHLGDALEATMVDISEGGAAIGRRAWVPASGTLVKVSLDLGDRTVTLDAEVLRHEELATGELTAALRFVDPERHGDDIRRFALALQRLRASAGLNP